MAASDKNIVISPQRGSATLSPSIVFTGDGADPISIYALDGTPGSLSFEGSAGQLFSITNSLTTGSIFSVNDVSGIPSLDIDADGTISIAPYAGKTLIGTTVPITGLFGSAINFGATVNVATKDAEYAAIFCSYRDDTTYNGFSIAKSKTTTPGSHGLIGPGEYISGLSFDGSDGTQFINAGQIRVGVEGTPAVGNMPSFMEFLTNPGSATVATPKMRITSTGNVGIGTISPSVKLEVYGDLRIKATDGSHGIEFYPDIAALGYQRIISYNRTSSAYDDLSIGANNFIVTSGASTETLRVSSTGNVGIGGITTPSYKLDVLGDVRIDGNLTITQTTTISGLNADKLDGLDSSQFLRSDASNTMDAGQNTTLTIKCDDNGQAGIRLHGDSQGTGFVEVGQSTTYGGGMSYNGDGSPAFISGETADHITFYNLNNGTRTEVFSYPYNSTTVYFNGIVSASSFTGNGASITNVDADLLDGQQGSYYQPASSALTTSTTFGGDVSGTYNAIVVANDSHTHDGRYFTETESDARFLGISAKAADSNLLDGIDSGSFLRSDADDTTTGTLTLSKNGAQLAFDRPDGTGQDWRFYQWASGLNIYPSAGTSDVFFGRDGSTTHVDLWNGGLKVAGTTVLNNSRQLSSVTYGGNTIWHAGNDGSGSGLDADTVDGYQGGDLANSTHTATSASNRAVGWYTVATNAGNRAVARFGIRDTASGDHQSCVFYASHHYGNNSEITVLHSGRYSGTPFRYIRIKEGGTYDGALLQVYIDDATNALTFYLLGDNFQDSGWVIKNWVADGTNPGGVSNFAALTNVAAQVDLDQIIDGGMVTTGNIYSGGKTSQSLLIGLGNDGAGSGLDADLLDGQQGSYYQPASTALTTSTTFGGDVGGTYNAIVIADDSHNHVISNVDGLQTALDAKSPLASPAFTGTPTAPTASAGTNTTQIATTAFVSAAVSNLVDSAPGTLDTLNELAAALGDDANFSTTVTNSIATKLSLSGGQMTGNITFSGAQTVDGRDLSVDGAKLDGIESGATADQTAAEIKTAYESNANTNAYTDAEKTKLSGIASGAEVNVQSDWNATSGDAFILNKPTIPTNNNQLTNGAGYITSFDITTQTDPKYLRSDANDTTTGYLGAEGFVGMGGGALRLTYPHGASYATTTSSVTGAIKITLPVSWTDTMLRMTIKIYEYSSGESFEVQCGGYTYGSSSTWINVFGYIIGDPGAGRDFNIRFGHDGSKCCIYIGETNSTWSYPQVAVTEFIAGYNNYSEDTWNDGWSISFATSLGTITQNISQNQVGKYVDGNTVWNAGNDGSGSGLDADLLDGQHGSYYLNYNNFTNTPTIPTNNNQLTNGAGYITGNQTITLTGDVSGSGTTSISVTVADDSHNHIISNVDGLQTALDAKQAASTALTTSTTFGGDVSGTYNAIVVADDSHTHDGRYYTETESDARYFRRDTSNNVDVRLTSGNGRGLRFWDSNDYKIWMSSATDASWGGRLDSTSDYNMYFRMTGGTNRGFVFQNNTTEVFQIESTGQVRTASNNIYANGNQVWHAGNDGSGSGLDADLLDGQQGSYYQPASTALTTSTTFGGDVSGTYNAIVVADDSHNHVISNVDGLQTALDAKAPLSSPALTGTPTAPTAAAGTNTTQIATTAFVSTAVSNLVDSAPATLDTLNELAAALGDDPNFATTVTTSIGTKLPLAGGTMTGALLLDNASSASAPDLSFDGDPNTGIYSPGADQVALSTGGTGRLFVDASGNVGVGASPVVTFAGQTHLTVNHSAGGTTVAGLNLATDGTRRASLITYPGNSEALRITAESATLPITFHTNSSERMRLDSSGRLGLGTSSPSQLLDVAGSARFGGNTTKLTTYSDSTYAGFFNGSSLVSNESIYMGAGGTYFYNNGAASVTIDSSGRLGVGTTPSERLHVSGGNARFDGNYVSFGSNGYIRTDATNELRFQSGSNGTSFWNTGLSSEMARFDTSGRLLVGTASNPGFSNQPGIILQGTAASDPAIALARNVDASSIVSGNMLGNIAMGSRDGGIGAQIKAEGDGTWSSTSDCPGRLVFSTTADGASSPTERMRIDSSGRAGIGTTTPQAPLSVSNGGANGIEIYSNYAGTGQSGVTSFNRSTLQRTDLYISTNETIFLTSGTERMKISSNGVVTISGNTVWHAGNDGSGSGLDADLLDGQNSSYFLDTSSTTQTKTGGLNVHGDVYIVNYSSYSSSASLYIAVSSSTKGAITTKTTVTDTRAHMRFENSNGVVGGITTSGSATSYLTSSDYRLKENITGISDGISRVKQLRPVRFNFIPNQSDTANDTLPGEVQTGNLESPILDGFLAHEAQDVVPECVSGQKDETDENGNPIYQGIDQSKLVPLLTAALQEAITKIEELESRLNTAGL